MFPAARRTVFEPTRMGLALGAVRLGVGVGFLAAPVASTRVLGLDSATAKRITFLARMAAVRDLVLGAGTVASARQPNALRTWVAAGAAADLGDAILITAAIRSRVAGGLPAVAITASAAGAAAVGGWAAAGIRR
jgi:hypothetical protein